MKRRLWYWIVLLSLVEGSKWVLDEAFPGMLHGLLRTAVHDCVLALGFAVLSFRKRGWGGVGLWLKLAIAAVALFAVPEILFTAASGHVSDFTGLLLFLLVPVVVVVVVAQRSASFGAEENPLRLLVPAVAGLGGATLVLPYYWPESTAGRLWLAALVFSAVLAGLAVVRLHGLLRGVDVLRGATVILGAAGIAAAAFCWMDWAGAPPWVASAVVAEALRCLLVEAPVLLLTVWLLREMTPVRFSARWLLVVLVMIVGSYAVARPALTWTTALGVLLIAGSAVGLLRADSEKVL